MRADVVASLERNQIAAAIDHGNDGLLADCTTRGDRRVCQSIGKCQRHGFPLQRHRWPESRQRRRQKGKKAQHEDVSFKNDRQDGRSGDTDSNQGGPTNEEREHEPGQDGPACPGQVRSP